MVRPSAAVLLLALAVASPASAQTSSREVIESLFAAMNRHDAAAMASLYAPDAVVIASDACAPQIGADKVRTSHEGLFRAMPDLQVETRDWFVDGDRVALIVAARSSKLGPNEALFADFFTLRNGKIVRDVTLFNPGRPCR